MDVTKEATESELDSGIRSEFDGPWKDVLDIYFEQFMAFCWSLRYAEIDWQRGYKTLDKELTRISRDAVSGKH